MGRSPLGLWGRVRIVVGLLLRALPSWQTWLALGLIVVAAALSVTYVATQRIVRIELNGLAMTQRSHQRSADAILRELGIVLQPSDLVEMPSREALSSGTPISLTIARHIVLVHDGGATRVASQASDVAQALRDTDVVIFPHDRLILAGEPCTLETLLPTPDLEGLDTAAEIVAAIRRPIRLTVRRAVPITVHDGALPITFHTTTRTIGDALYDHKITVYAGDDIRPGLDTEITPDLQVYIQRAKPVTLDVGGRSKMLRTRLETVRELLDSEGLALGEHDYIKPDLGALIERDLSIALVRVLIERYVEEIPIPFETRLEPDVETEIDQRRTVHWGREGALRRRLWVRYENESETERTIEEEWMAREPIDRVTKYGTKIVLRQLDTPSGPITYWRHLRMLATSYNAPTAGKPMTHPSYAITKIGLRARKGLIAVDPRVIELRQEMYIPDYGMGIAADTGGAIKWRRVDLCYDDDNLVLWRKWIDVYLLEPIPDQEDINWMIPNSPKERD